MDVYYLTHYYLSITPESVGWIYDTFYNKFVMVSQNTLKVGLS